ncbi:MAG: AAA family ATPase, partial [Chloroflexota bacterium]|nr:AAA family ATPase [Chloroflexota bacterium]
MSENTLVVALLDPASYPERPESVELIETHVSWLFLAGQRVYKVKKPVDFGFLDFTTLERRRHFCQEEVALNRRLSPDVYLGVDEIRERDGRLTIEGPGQTVEYAVVMRRLPRQQALSELLAPGPDRGLARGEVSEDSVRRIAARIAQFHREAATSDEIARLGGYDAVAQNVRENFAQTEAYVGRTIERGDYDELRAYSEAFLEVRQPEFRAREREGWVRDCHGDLHTAQIFLDDGIHIIDCIEFNQRFRYSDVAADIAFLAMDLDRHGRQDLSAALVSAYRQALGDAGFLDFLDFFKVYRAYVRGKVEGFRLGQPPARTGGQPGLAEVEAKQAQHTAGGYFELARSYLCPLPRPTLFLTAGLMGAGKTRLAENLARRWGLEHISSDLVRKELAGIEESEHRYEPFNQGIYSQESTLKTYQEMFRRAAALLRQGRSVVLDASFSNAALRREALS